MPTQKKLIPEETSLFDLSESTPRSEAMTGGKISVVEDCYFVMDRLGVKPAKAGEVDHSVLF